MERAAGPRPWPSVAAIALAAAALRALAFSGTELYSDEAYYWLWAQRPAAGYFDHPPLVAWLVALGSPLAPGELGVRLLFLACGGLTVVFAALLARELTEELSLPPLAGGGRGRADRAMILAALLAASCPLLNLVGALALPDAPLAAAYTGALWLLARARGARWVWAGLAVGLALLAKYTAALLAPALVLLVLWDGELRRALRGPWPWLGAAAALLVFAPCLAWNAQHGWISIRFQLGHGFASNATFGSFLTYLGGQLAAAGPVPLAAGLLVLVRPRGSAAKRVAAAVLVPLAVTTWSAARGKVEANWPALVYPALAAAAAAGLVRLRPGVARALAGASVALTLAALALFAAEQRRPQLLSGTAAVERFHGWRAMAAEARRLAGRACAEAGCDPARVFVYPASYQYAAELAYYGGFGRLGPAAERPSQLDLWGARPTPGEPFLFVGANPAPGPEIARLARAEGERPTESVVIRYRDDAVRKLSVTLFGHYRGPPSRD